MKFIVVIAVAVMALAGTQAQGSGIIPPALADLIAELGTDVGTTLSGTLTQVSNDINQAENSLIAALESTGVSSVAPEVITEVVNTVDSAVNGLLQSAAAELATLPAGEAAAALPGVTNCITQADTTLTTGLKQVTTNITNLPFQLGGLNVVLVATEAASYALTFVGTVAGTTTTAESCIAAAIQAVSA